MTVSANLLRDIKRISGPASYYAFELPGSKNNIYLFGDYHFSYNNQCDGCDKDPACAHIADFIDSAIDEAASQGTPIDVFMELPYVVSQGVERDFVLARVDTIFMRDSRENVKNVLLKIFGRTPDYIGIFSVLYKRFSDKFYGHASASTNQRFHYADARFEFNVKRFLSPASERWIKMFHHRVPNVATFRRVLEAFVMGHHKGAFQDEMADVFGSDIMVFERSLTSKKSGGRKTLHKISKQVHKLPPTLRTKVELFIKEKLDGICDVLRLELRYEDGVHMLRSDESSLDMRDGTLTYIRASRLVNYIGIFTVFMELIVQTIMMDVYLLARMLLYASRSHNGSCIVYAGDYHIGVYADFLSRHMNLTANGCSVPSFPSTMTDQQVQSMVQRCVGVNLGTCDLSAILPNKRVSHGKGKRIKRSSRLEAKPRKQPRNSKNPSKYQKYLKI